MPVIQKFDPVISSARSCSFQTESSNTAKVTITTVEIVAGFVASPEAFTNNYVGYMDYVQKQLDERFRKMAATVDQAAVDFMQANANGFWPADITQFYPQVGDVFQVPQADKNDFYNNLTAIYGAMDYDMDDIKVVHNYNHLPLVNRFMNQGANNSVNEQFQFAPYAYYGTNRLANGVGEESRVISFPKGSLFMLDQLNPSAANGRRIHDSKYWDVFRNVPHLNGDVGVFYQADCADVNGTLASLSGLTADKLESWELSYRYAFVSAYNSDPVTSFNPIVESAILS